MIATTLFLSALLALFFLLRPVLRPLIGSEWLCLLWLVLLLRLLVPWPLHSPLGLINASGHPVTTQPDPESPLKIKITFPAPNSAQQIDHPATVMRPAAPPPLRSSAPIDLSITIWLIGFIGALALLASRWLKTIRRARQTIPATDQRLLAIYASIPAAWRKSVTLRISPDIDVPSLYGIIRPQIWMPSTWLAEISEDQIRCILLHELGHARRGDLAVQWLFAIAGCIHWFNPVVWLASRAARLDREMACDAWVLARENSQAYGQTLLKALQLISGERFVPAAAIAMATSRRGLRARFAGIAAFRPARTWPGIIGMVSMLAIIAATTSTRTSIAQSPTPPAPATPPPAATASPSPSTAPPGLLMVSVEAKFLEMDAKAWDQARRENAQFRNATADFPDLGNPASIHPVLSGSAPDTATLSALKTLGSDKWTFKDGAWQNVTRLGGAAVIYNADFQKILRYLNGLAGVDLLSSPKVSTRSGQRAVVEVVREFRYPTDFEPDKKAAGGWSPTNFRTQNMGVSLEANCTYETAGNSANTFELELMPEITSFLGFLPEKSGGEIKVGPMHDSPGYWRPIFSVSRGKVDLNVFPGQVVLLAGQRIDNKSAPGNTDNLSGQINAPGKTESKISLIFVESSIEAPKGIPTSDEKPPYATAIPGIAGYVISPFTPGAYIDVRAFTKGAKVKDPYSGNEFLVP